MATLLRTDGTKAPITERLTLQTMQQIIGGYVEIVHVGGTRARRVVLIVDEDGHGKQKPLNLAATALYRGFPSRHDGVIVGDAIECVCTNMGLDNESYE